MVLSISLHIFNFGYTYFVTIIPAPPKKTFKNNKTKQKKYRLFLTVPQVLYNLHYSQIYVN